MAPKKTSGKAAAAVAGVLALAAGAAGADTRFCGDGTKGADRATYGAAFDDFLAKCPKSCTQSKVGETRADGTALDTCIQGGDQATWTPRKQDGHWGNIFCRTTTCAEFLDQLLADDKNFYCSPDVLEFDTGAPTDPDALAEYDDQMERLANGAKLRYANIKNYCSQEALCVSTETEGGESWEQAYKDFATECGELCKPGDKCEPYGNKCRTTSCRKSLAFLDVGRSAKCNPRYVNGQESEADVKAEWDNIQSVCTSDKDYSDQIEKPKRSSEDNSSPNLHSLVGTLAGLAFSGLCILLA